MIEKRSIPMSIVFTIITCGIYSWYWDYKLWDTLYRASGKESKAGMDIVFSLITCGIYYIYMMYKMGKMQDEAYQAHGLGNRDDSVLYLVLGIFGLWIISIAIAQSTVNSLADTVNGVSDAEHPNAN